METIEKPKKTQSKVASKSPHESRAIKVGVCAMEKKSMCNPMTEILTRLNALNDFEILIFPEHVILNEPIENWPVVDCLIAFYSTGFPLQKAQAYVELRKPFLINDVKSQERLLWRHKVYETLVNHGIPTPKHYVLMKDRPKKKSNKDKKSLEDHPSEEEDDEKFFRKAATMAKDAAKKKYSGEKIIPSNPRKSSDKSQVKYKPPFQGDPSNPDDILTHINANNPIKRKGSDLQEEVRRISFSMENSNIDDVVAYLRNESTLPLVSNHSEPNKQSESGEYQAKPLARKMSENLDLPGRLGLMTKPEKPTPANFIDPYSGYQSKTYSEVIEHEDFLEFGTEKLKKPFVEKPIDAENHNINIYYPVSDGGGCKRLFRKTKNISSDFDPNCMSIRTGESYIYEEFLPTEGFDIKVYTVGPNYAHAETRKAPVLDGVVQRTKDGKEVRYPVNLTYDEKLIAKKIVIAFGQNVCGFDLLRSKGKSYVCDVNGWSFVKGSNKYYADCAILLREMILARFAPERINPLSPQLALLNSQRQPFQLDQHIFRPVPDSNSQENLSNLQFQKEELRSVVAIFRHGDRKPKQKMKMIVTDKRYLDFINNQDDTKKEITLKSAKLLEKILNITKEILSEVPQVTEEGDNENDVFSKILQLYSVLKQSEQFEGINRKIQLKPLAWEENPDPVTGKYLAKQALLILKWGGELTHSGILQAQELGAHFREEIYPPDNEGLVRLHSTYRHDLKIYSSEEGRCQKTAAAFCKGLLELEGDLPPILVSLVRKDEATQELLDFNKRQEDSISHMLSKNLSKIMNTEQDLYESVKNIVGEEHIDDHMKKILQNIGKPLELLKKTHDLIKDLTSKTRKFLAIKQYSYYLNPKDFDYKQSNEQEDEFKCEEPLILTYKRWRKLEIDLFKKKEGFYDISKIPDVHYSIRYDILHSKQFVEINKETCKELLNCVGKLAKFIIPAEFGLTPKEKVTIGLEIVSNLLHKIKHDLIWWNTPFISKAQQVIKDEQCFLEHRGLNVAKLIGDEIKSTWRHVRTRLYFTSASHLYTLFNVISLGVESSLIHIKKKDLLKQMISMDYLSNITIRLYENLNAAPEDPNRFRLEILVSRGCDMEKAREEDIKKHIVPIAPHIMLNSQLTLREIENFFDDLFKVGDEKIEEPGNSPCLSNSNSVSSNK